MTGPLTKSVVFHVVVGLLIMFGFPLMKHKPPEIADSVSVELVKVDELTQTNKPPPTAPLRQPRPIDKPPEETPPKPAAPQVTAKTPPKPTPPQKPAAKNTPTPPKEPDKAEVVQKDVAKPQPKPDDKKPVETKQAEEQDFQSLLRNLAPADQSAAAPAETLDKDTKPSPLAQFGQQMTSSELDALKTQLSQCWQLMAGARYAEDLSVDIKLFMNADRSVRDAQVVDQFRYSSDTYFRAAADSALRAVRNPHCNPLELPPDKYDQWKIMTVTFDPREML